MQRLISQIGRSQRLAVVNLLKRKPEGIPVKALAERLDMSYMGVKQICLDLEKGGYLDTFRRNRGVGRPEVLYRLTAKANDLFPQAENTLAISLLNNARKLFGPQSADKLLFLHFQEKAAAYQEKIKSDDPAARLRALVRLREAEGYMPELAENPLRIIERNHPMQPLFEAFPGAVAMERDLIQKVLSRPVRREQTACPPGTYECVFFVG